jgi:hypothetical protein
LLEVRNITVLLAFFAVLVPKRGPQRGVLLFFPKIMVKLKPLENKRKDRRLVLP